MGVLVFVWYPNPSFLEKSEYLDAKEATKG